MASGNLARMEDDRLLASDLRRKNWKRWGPYLSDRQWATVREDYSPDGSCWTYFPHADAHRRAYRWGEDGLLGICDRECRLCFAPAFWNGKDPILKERLFGLTGPQGNHGEDVKEAYFHLDSLPTHSYLKGLYKYPQNRFPYELLVEENARRGVTDREYELADTGIFNDGRYFDIFVEYAKASPNDILIRLTITNAGPDTAPIHVLPTLWFRNTWSWGCTHEGCWRKPLLELDHKGRVKSDHPTLEPFVFQMDPALEPALEQWLFTENETNSREMYGVPDGPAYAKDAFHKRVVYQQGDAVNPKMRGTKAAPLLKFDIDPGQSVTLRLRLSSVEELPRTAFGKIFDTIFEKRIAESDEYYHRIIPEKANRDQANITRQAYAGLLWSKQFYHYGVDQWLNGDPNLPPPPAQRWLGRNADWRHLFNRDVISMPDKWEYPWYAAWDLAFHMIPMARLDPYFAKRQLVLLLREWYMHPSGQIPAYEFAFDDVNPPVHAWACWRVYKRTAPRGKRDREFLSRTFQKLLLNFTWWVNRKDVKGRHLFAGGFLGLDNIGVFDRSRPLPRGGHLNQADGTAWMAFYCNTMLAMALELAHKDVASEDMASKFFEHFVAIADAMNSLGGTGLWDEQDGFYYDKLELGDEIIPLRIRSMVGLIPLIAAEVLDSAMIDKLPGFKKRMDWFLTHRKDLNHQITYMECSHSGTSRYLLAIPSRERLERVLKYMLDENEFLSPYGLRSLSKYHQDNPYIFEIDGQRSEVRYVPGESETSMFGGNSNWRGPVWFPLNFLIMESLQRYHHFYGDDLKVECPTGSGNYMNLREVAKELARRLARLFEMDDQGRRPCHDGDPFFSTDPRWKDLILFYEHFHGDNGRGLGASHQTGWTALVADFIYESVRTDE